MAIKCFGSIQSAKGLVIQNVYPTTLYLTYYLPSHNLVMAEVLARMAGRDYFECHIEPGESATSEKDIVYLWKECD